MTASESPEPLLRRASAQVFVTDFERALTFYRDRLGFEVVFTHGEPPFYGEVRRGDAAFNLRLVEASPFVEGAREQEQLLSVYLQVSDAEGLLAEFRAAGVDIHEELQSKPWGADEFIVRDPDGNLLLVGTPSA